MGKPEIGVGVHDHMLAFRLKGGWNIVTEVQILRQQKKTSAQMCQVRGE